MGLSSRHVKSRIGAALVGAALLFLACSEDDPAPGDEGGTGGEGQEPSSAAGRNSSASVPAGGAGPKQPCESWTSQEKPIDCELPIGEAPEGSPSWEDPQSVYVYIRQSGSERLVPFDPECERGEGWYYGAVAGAPGISLCPDTCSSLREDEDSSFQAILDCYHPSIFPDP
jgi:hypothetical protein